ncbi:MAG: xanthine dehydrogenase family protein molybdopterin-binding subunit [Burkholderiales bacterium]|nr:xanthine dehydrogenase family protein molybdopterin-binding subunit [Burkholderiales bacterium]
MQNLPYTLATNARLDRWVRIHDDGTVSVLTGRVEIGQGIVTAMAQMAADELDVALERVRMPAVDTTLSPDEGTTSGSRSVEEGGTALRHACAEVRDLLLQTAARKFGTTLESLTVEDGTIHVRGRDDTITYWQLAPEVDLARDARGDVQPKAAGALKIVGREIPRTDIPGKLFGAAFVHDLDLPGMLHARVVRPPSYRARLQAANIEAVRALPGVTAVVREGSFLAVAAAREEQAIKAARALAGSARWSEHADLPDVDALPAFLTSQPTDDEVLSESSAKTAPPVHELASDYSRPYLAHASTGPSCALARWNADGTIEVWSHCQGPYPLRDEIGRILGIERSTIVVRHMQGAGCYGHNGADDAAFDAVIIARAVPGTPVRLQWMREDEFGWEPFGPTAFVRMRGGVDACGRIVDWQQDHYTNRHLCRPGRHPNPGLLAAWHFDQGHEPPPTIDPPLASGGGSQRNAIPGYVLANHRVVNHALRTMPVRISTLRALGAHINVFAIESFMDELAAAAGVDALEFRLRHLEDKRARAVVEAVAERAGWRKRSHADRDNATGLGIGYARYKGNGNYVACIAEVVVEQRVRVPRIWTALDCGRIVNPDGMRNQAEGGIVQAASWTLKEQVRFDRTRITSRNWDEYPILTFAEAPQVECVLIDRPEETSLGAGEGMAGPTAAAIGNGLANALGVRVRDLPFTPERIVAAIENRR